MNYSYIEQLLARYWEAETTLHEEQILQSFFLQEDVPEHLQQYARYFVALSTITQQHLSEEFDERVMKRAGAADSALVVKARPLTLHDRLRPFLRAAAVVAVFALVGGSISYSIIQKEEQRDADYTAHAIKNDSLQLENQIVIDVENAMPTALLDTTRMALPN